MEENLVINLEASNDMPESGNNPKIVEESPRICPLCSSEVLPFFINFELKAFLCKNVKCDFPFGYEDVQYVRYESSNILNHSKKESSALLQIDKPNQLDEAYDNHPVEHKILNTRLRKGLKQKCSYIDKNKRSCNVNYEKEIEKNAADVKELALQLNNIVKPQQLIKNEKWISKLKHLQDSSGVKLVNPLENEKLATNQNINGDVKIDIQKGSCGSTLSIKIEMLNQKLNQ